MNKDHYLDLNNCNIDNNLWPKFVSRIGLQRAQSAIIQSMNLQSMYGNSSTMPILIIETCGSALAVVTNIKIQTGLPASEIGNILIYSSVSSTFQLLKAK